MVSFLIGALMGFFLMNLSMVSFLIGTLKVSFLEIFLLPQRLNDVMVGYFLFPFQGALRSLTSAQTACVMKDSSFLVTDDLELCHS